MFAAAALHASPTWSHFERLLSPVDSTVRRVLEKRSSSPEKTPAMRVVEDGAAVFRNRPLGFPPADWQLQTQTTTMNLYQSMTGLKTAAPGPRSGLNNDLYEKCIGCQGKWCLPPPRVTPATFTAQYRTAGPDLRKRTQEHEESHDQEVFHDGSQTVVGMHQSDMATVQSEGKRFFSSCLSFLLRGSSLFSSHVSINKKNTPAFWLLLLKLRLSVASTSEGSI